ncbi:hypothetical protein [Methylobacterium sp. ID0610]|uniref:hypothetical protein n=1 Tax=Methylobacterium carpenticola TaxID=3344827 RepID=UPI0036A7EF28
MDESAMDTLLYIGVRDESGPIVVNNHIGGNWGVENFLQRPRTDDNQRNTVWFKFHAGRIEMWNSIIALNFDRFDESCSKRVRLVKLEGVVNQANSLRFLVMTPEAMAAEIGYNVLHRRIDLLERSKI